jgi:hypothetical protein
VTRKLTKAEQIRQKRWPEIRDRIEQEESYSAIAKDIGVSPATMLKWLMQEGYKYKTKGRYPVAMRGRVKEMVERGWEIEDVAEILKVDKLLAVRWYTEPLPEPKEKAPKENPAPRRHQLSAQAQRLIGDPAVPRHKRGRKWEMNQKRFVVDLIKKRFSVIEIYRIMGASKARQSRIWKEVVSKHRTPPNFPSEDGPAKPMRRLGESPRAKQRRTRRELAAARRRDAKSRGLQRRRSLAEQRRAAVREGTRPPAALPPPEPGTPVVMPPAEEERVFVEPRALPPSRETALPRPPWERKKKKPKKPKKKKRKRRGR